MYDLGEYPGAVPGKSGQLIAGKIFEIPEDPELLERLDEYEEFDAEEPEESLFLRKKWPVTRAEKNERLVCWIYVYNRRPPPVRPVRVRPTGAPGARKRKSRH